jgi:hypothetical protein
VISFEARTSGEPVDLDYIRDVEEGIGVPFPPSFIEFVKGENGGIPIEKYFDLDGNEKVVERFLSFVPDYKENDIGCYDIEVVWSQIEGRLNDYLCPFAALFAGDFLCFDSEDQKETRIVLWDHEKSEEDYPVLIEVATNFESFLSLLHS